MGVLTLSNFHTEVLAALGNRTEDTSITLARVVTALNMAQSRISRAHAFSELSQVSFAQMNFTGTKGIDKFLIPPSDCRTIHSFVLLDTSGGGAPEGSSRKVIEKPWRWFDARFPAPEWLAAGWPEFYTRWGRFIVMAPAPIQQFTAQLRYVSHPTPFVVSVLAQASDFEGKDDIILNYTIGYFFKTLGRADRAAFYEGLAKEQLDEAIERDDERPDLEVSRDVATGALDGEYWANPFINGVR